MEICIALLRKVISLARQHTYNGKGRYLPWLCWYWGTYRSVHGKLQPQVWKYVAGTIHCAIEYVGTGATRGSISELGGIVGLPFRR